MRPGQRSILLIVEDDASLRELMQAAAEKTGLFTAIATAPDGQAALDHVLHAVDHAPEQVPEYILSDLSMPRMDGIELITALKRNPATKHIPIAVMTSSHRANDRSHARAAGCSAFFAKPIRIDDLVSLIRSIPRICGPTAVVSAYHPDHSA